MENPYSSLVERGLLKQETRPQDRAVSKLFEEAKEPVPVYAGFDCTATSLHVGHLLPVMGLIQIQRAGHKPIALVGGATTMIGDPTGRTEARPSLSAEEIQKNTDAISKQLGRYLDLDGEKGVMVNNLEWLGEVMMIDFLRDVGSRFTISEMLTTETYKTRLESGLTFLEFAYQLFQSYDFVELYRRHNCLCQIGGDDQWGNIVAGIDLVRRMESIQVEGFTFPLLTTAGGKKMGKTESGAVWLDPNQTSPLDFYQYWRNVDDADVIKLLKFFTLLELEEIEEMAKWEGKELNKAKEKLAWETTKLCHGEEEADKSQKAAKGLFGQKVQVTASTPTIEVEKSSLEEEWSVLEAFVEAGLTKSKGEGRRKIKQGGLYVNDEKVTDVGATLGLDDITEEHDGIMLRFGKKKFCLVQLAGGGGKGDEKSGDSEESKKKVVGKGSSGSKFMAKSTISMPVCDIEPDALEGGGLHVLKAFQKAELIKSIEEGQELIKTEQLYVNDVRVADDGIKLTKDDIDDSGGIMLKKGEKKYTFLRVRRLSSDEFPYG